MSRRLEADPLVSIKMLFIIEKVSSRLSTRPPLWEKTITSLPTHLRGAELLPSKSPHPP